MTRQRATRVAPEVRRRQLIDATLVCIERSGISGLTLGEVATEAGLAQGIVNLHFQSKDNLLNETLRSLADQYEATVAEALAGAGPEPADRLAAVVAADFSPAVCNRRSLAVWFAFYGEAKSRPTYRRICRARDAANARRLTAVVEDLLAQGGGGGMDARTIADSLAALTDGLWLNCLMSPNEWSRRRARDTTFAVLESLFPQHLAGLVQG
ncbi:transcriptional regulator BetI [Lentisalinibacter orientalis]|uniref:transcriptional regulator BetI n=1 Tax=Lentisalinibacter orientalis TaxID=2992241 RepID=UPI003869662E